MNVKTGLKAIITTGASLCTGYTVDKVTKGVIPDMEGMPMPAKIAIKAGSYLIGSAIGRWVGDQTEKTYDQVEEMVVKTREAMAEGDDADDAIVIDAEAIEV
mgnify:CR=1 FL=1